LGEVESKSPLMDSGAPDDPDSIIKASSALSVRTRGSKPGTPIRQRKVTLAMEFDIPEDAYGAAILALAKDLTDVVSEDAISGLAITRLMFPMVILAANLVLQFLCLSYINKYVVSASVHHVQETFFRFHRDCFQPDGSMNQTEWARYDHEEKANLCQIAMTNQIFYYTILLIWTLSALHEIRTGQRLAGNIYRVPHANSVGEQIYVEDTDEEKIYIRALKPIVRCLMIVLVVLPKIIISVSLMGLGMRWLSATTSFEELVMNAVAMTFVTQIDELLYQFALPAAYRNQVADINFSIADFTPEEVEREAWLAYVRSAFYFTLSFLLVWIYAEIVQDVLPNRVYELRTICSDWQRQHTSLKCQRPLFVTIQKMFTEGMNALKTPPECYPFGRGSHDVEDI